MRILISFRTFAAEILKINCIMNTNKPLCQRSKEEVLNYVRDIISDWPTKLTHEEKRQLDKTMCESVESMRLKCMTQTQRAMYYQQLHEQELARQESEKQSRAKQLRTHILEV